jgi:hypothetical protein
VQAFQPSKDIRLVMLDGKSASAKYVALSHCWGRPSKLPLTTRMANLSQHLQRISFSDLPLTFKDAVKLTLNLGHRYLWIDSLCIVQDDPEDWLREASKVGSVYGNALVTLSALSSVDSTRGCRIANARATTHDHRFLILAWVPTASVSLKGRSGNGMKSMGTIHIGMENMGKIHCGDELGHYRRGNCPQGTFTSLKISCFGNARRSKHIASYLGMK